MGQNNHLDAISVQQLDHCELPFCASRDDMAPTFAAEAFINNQIQNVRLEDFRGKWMILFFYASDFTFV